MKLNPCRGSASFEPCSIFDFQRKNVVRISTDQKTKNSSFYHIPQSSFKALNIGIDVPKLIAHCQNAQIWNSAFVNFEAKLSPAPHFHSVITK
jgi:hypothetical protein